MIDSPRMVRLLDRYVARTFLGSYLVCLVFFLGLFLLVDFFARLDDFLEAREYLGNTHYGLLGLIFRYYVLSVPTVFSQIAPFVTLMGAMFALTRLSRNNELVPMIVSGVSTYRILVPVFLFALLLSGSLIALRQFVIPDLAREKEAIEDIINGKDPRFIREVEHADAEGNRYGIKKYDASAGKMHGLDFTSVGTPIRTVTATMARWRNEGESGPGWYLTNGEELIAQADGTMRERVVHFLFGTTLRPEDLELDALGDNLALLSFSDINRLYHRHPDRKELKVLLHSQITFPLSNLLLLLLGIPLVVNRRIKSPFLSIAVCLLICGAFFAADFLAQDLGRRGFYPVTMAWLPVVLFSSVGICLFDSIRT